MADAQQAAPVSPPGEALPLEAVRARIDEIDAGLLALLDERTALGKQVAAAKAAAGQADRFGLRPGRETEILRRLLAMPRTGASDALIIRVWRELMGQSLALQGPFNLTVWGGAAATRAVELARLRFGAAPPLRLAAKPEDTLAAARLKGGVGVAMLTESAWWGRLLAEPKLKVFAVLPCLNAWGPPSALAFAEVEVEPTGADVTLWVTDAPGPAAKVAEALSRDGVAAELLSEAGGLKLFTLAGYYQANDERLARAPGRLSGVIGAAPEPFDV
ncbi:MAG: chorismate mutase [Phenylobacterium sp.]|uniref:chorismate mutase n=1 Tax=Phenylobacterium sp. TaxID=1871053 RepID=UPI002722E3ED|nr:chorismate mutase [Phenylobacterium sp.]MDO8899720.1 chorismate mutase [Phenylobacterium sp.]